MWCAIRGAPLCHLSTADRLTVRAVTGTSAVPACRTKVDEAMRAMRAMRVTRGFRVDQVFDDFKVFDISSESVINPKEPLGIKISE